QKEQWQLQVNRPDGTPADARVIATMYDKSLDEFVPHGWQMGLSLDRSLYNGRYASQRDGSRFSTSQDAKVASREYPVERMSHLKSDLMGSEMLIRGVVVDENDEPVIGATVTVERNSRVGTATDIDGKFEVLAHIGDKIVVSYIGYGTQRIIANDRHPVVVKMGLDEGVQLDEVVVTGYQKVDKRLFTGSVTASVNDVAAMGTFGSASKIRVRGATSIYGDARPLIVVDGVIVDLATQLSVDALSSVDANALIASMLPNISANDIRDFKILTDPSATAIYGARASAGVILINTVKGDGAQAIARTLDLPARENLNETAFFFPTLQTDEQGRVNLQYTLPESVTTWRVMTQAHTRDMCWGALTGEVVASKQFMVQPNVPRFVRMGDTATITSRIVNTCDHDVRGAVSMQLVDTETDRVVYTQHQAFAAAQGESTTVTFSYKPQQSETLLMCKVVASNGEASDGEQHYLPVLSQLELVTRTVPFTLLGKGQASIDLSKLEAKKALGAQYTLEYTNNPAWLMMQALHEYSHPVDDCAACQAIAYFSLKTAAGILSMSPQVAQTMQQWRDEQDSVGRQSPLERNQELKSIVLAETPWVGIAKNETEQRQQLSKFLDQTALNGKVSTTLSALKALHNGDGSWSWFKGMKGSVAMTQMVLEALVRVNVLLGKQRETQYMINSGFDYLARQGIDARYLYLAAMDNRDVPDSCRREGKKIIKAMKRDKSWHSAYSDCIMATTLWKWGEKKAARQRLDAVMANMLSSKAMGRYFDATSHGYWWYDLKIPTQVAAIEAMQLIHPDDTTAIEEMRRWLLQQKRTQYWSTAYNTANAVYAFINGNLRVLDEVPMADFSVDGRRIDLPQGSAGLGYVKTDLKWKEPYRLTVNKSHAGTSWGTVYAQFVQPSRAVEKSSSGISVKREIVKPGGDTLHVGDRVTVR
ncbi:MAG: carboxypeptidase-like regulatory domain-containing protein, partial [Muribaculaceae bacterium]|nr:carboxypeptidase-like regulatory domain-containing protein [Muribaculaceae bacterium]